MESNKPTSANRRCRYRREEAFMNLKLIVAGRGRETCAAIGWLTLLSLMAITVRSQRTGKRRDARLLLAQ